MPHPTERDPGRWGRLHLTTRVRRLHRMARRSGETTLALKPWARALADGATPAEQAASADALDRKLQLSEAALAWHWLRL